MFKPGGMSQTPRRFDPPKPVRFTPPVPDGTTILPAHKIFVDLFSGASAPLSVVVGALALARLEPLDKLHGCRFDLPDDRHFRELCLIASSSIVGAASLCCPSLCVFLQSPLAAWWSATRSRGPVPHWRTFPYACAKYGVVRPFIAVPGASLPSWLRTGVLFC